MEQSRRGRGNSPLKGAKHHRCLSLSTVTSQFGAESTDIKAIGVVSIIQAVNPDGEGDEGGKPEEHGQSIQS